MNNANRDQHLYSMTTGHLLILLHLRIKTLRFHSWQSDRENALHVIVEDAEVFRLARATAQLNSLCHLEHMLASFIQQHNPERPTARILLLVRNTIILGSGL